MRVLRKILQSNRTIDIRFSSTEIGTSDTYISIPFYNKCPYFFSLYIIITMAPLQSFLSLHLQLLLLPNFSSAREILTCRLQLQKKEEFLWLNVSLHIQTIDDQLLTLKRETKIEYPIFITT